MKSATNPRGLASKISQVVEPCPTNNARGYELDGVNIGRVEGKNPLDTNAVGTDLADRKRSLCSTFAEADDDALELLQTKLGLVRTFLNLVADPDGVSHPESRMLFCLGKNPLFKGCDQIVFHSKKPKSVPIIHRDGL